MLWELLKQVVFQIVYVMYLIKLILLWVRWFEICFKPLFCDVFSFSVLPTKDPCHPIADSFLNE